MNIWLLEDDPAQAELLSHWLVEAGHVVTHFPTGAAITLLTDLRIKVDSSLTMDTLMPCIHLNRVKRSSTARLRLSTTAMMFAPSTNALPSKVVDARSSSLDCADANTSWSRPSSTFCSNTSVSFTQTAKPSSKTAFRARFGSRTASLTT